MSELTKKLHILKTGGTEETATLYDSTTDCPEPYLSFTVDGAAAYAKLGELTDDNATTLRVYRDSDKATYAVLKTAVTLVNVTIVQSDNQTIHVYTPQKEGGVDHTESFTIEKGTTYEAEVIADDGYEAGTLSVTEGGVNDTFTGDTIFTADRAVYGSKTFMLTIGEWAAFPTLARGFNEAGYSAYHFGSVNDNLPNGFKVNSLYFSGSQLLVATTPQLSSVSAVVFGDNEVAVTGFKVKNGYFGSAYYGTIPTDTKTWLNNHGLNTVGSQIKVTIYANDLF